MPKPGINREEAAVLDYEWEEAPPKKELKRS